MRVWARDVRLSGIEMIELDVGARLPMHAGPHFATCQVVRGHGKLGLPDRDVPFDGPVLCIFEAGADRC